MVSEQGRRASISRFENQHGGGYRVRFDPNNPVEPISVVCLEHIGQTELVDIAIDHPEQLYLLGDGAVTHNCKIGMGYHYRSRYEFVLFFEKGKRRLLDLSVPDVIEQASVRAGYPTEKPVPLSKVFIRQSTLAGELVVDPFMGSASTGAASLSLSRSFLGCDISSAALEVAAARLDQFQGARDVALHRAVSREGTGP
jgi:hypothetical protein